MQLDFAWGVFLSLNYTAIFFVYYQRATALRLVV